MARTLIIDTDPGQDDALALLLAFASPELEVVGVTAVAGNVPLALTQKNARRVCELAGRPDVAVHAGCSRPMLRPLITAEEVHGRTGLDGPDLPEPTMPLQPGHGVDFIIERCLAAGPAGITLCPLGPLTNIAMAIIKEPGILPNIEEIVLMGGGFFEGGNVTPAAEFNIHVDPHAAHVVFTAGVPMTMLPLDATHSAPMDPAWVASLRRLGNRTGGAAADMLEFYERFDVEKYGTTGGPLHDPCVIAYLLHPEHFSGRACHVAVEITSEVTMGMTVVDWWGTSGRPANCRVIRTVDSAGYYSLLTERLARLP